MKTYEFRSNRKPYYAFLLMFLAFTVLTIFLLWVFFVMIPKEAELSVFSFALPLFFGVLAIFAFYSMRKFAKPPKIIL